ALRCKCGFAAISAQRDARNRSGGSDSRLLPDGFEQAIHNSDAVLPKWPRDSALARENMIGAKTGRNGHDVFQAQPEERRTREQNKSESDLRDDEAVAQALGSAVDCAGARFRLQRVRQMTAGVEPGDRRRDHNSKNHRAAEAERREPSIKRDMRAER